MAKYFCMAMLVGGTALADAGPLDGHSYVIKYKEKGAWLSHKDTLIFKDGRFRSTACDDYGFGEGSYSAQEAASFSARTESAKEGRIEWRGQIHGQSIEGTFVWLKGGKSVEYTFTGSATK
jgi:hypothetical protein